VRTVLLACLVIGVASRPINAIEPDLPYKVGVASVDITPAHPIRLNGFGSRRTESEGVYQKLHARALAIDDGSQSPVVLLAVDVLGIPANIHDEVAKRLHEKTGLSKDRLAITATHTHTGPMLTGANSTLFGVPIPKEHLANIDKYTPTFVDNLESVALAALKDLKPAKLEWGVGKVSFAMNRRTKGGPVDHDLPVLFVKDEKGKVRAVYLSYACHCVTLSHNKLGGDWAGYAALSIEDLFPGSVALVAIGGGADQNPTSGVTGGKEDIALGQGREIAAEVRKLSNNYLTAITGRITSKVTTLDLPLAELPTEAIWEEKAKRMDAIGHHARVTLAKLRNGEKLPTKITYPVQTWAFGESLAMIHLPGEVVVDYALRFKKELDSQRIWFTGYANNAPCYIPSERVLKEGGYEGGGAMIYYDQPAPFAPGLEDKIVSTVKTHLGKSFAAKFDPKKTGDELPKSPQQSQSLIKTKNGLRVDLVAAEPLVADPVALAFGPDGKLWVAEMADYPSGRSGKFEPGGRIVFLESTKGDGNFDRSTVFLDNLPFPTGVLPWRKGVLICAAPDILYAEDTTGNGKPDKISKLYSGFGTENYQARVNSLQYGLDGWVYGSCGLFGGNILCHKTGKIVALGDRDFRIKPDTGELEPVTGRTQQGRVRDDRGNWFGCDNSNLIRQYALEDHYLRRNPFVAYPHTSLNLAPSNKLFSLKVDAQRFALSGPPNTVTAACGLGLYRDDLLGNEFTGNAFVCEPVNLLVTRLVLNPKGSSFTSSRAQDEIDSEFLASTDNWFRPVHAVTGPDGALWIADMYRYLIEHPRWIPAADLAKIDTRAGAGLGRIYRVVPADKPLRPWLRLDKLDTEGLVAALDSPNGWQRDTAMMMLYWRSVTDFEPLKRLMAGAASGQTLMTALCTLDLLGQVTKELIEVGLADRDPVVRQHAVRIAERYIQQHPGIAVKVMTLTDDPDMTVRLQVAYSLGMWPDARAATALAKLAFSDNSVVLSAVISSLRRENLPGFAEAVLAAKDDDPQPQLVRDLVATIVGVDNASALPKLLDAITESDRGRFREWQLVAATEAITALDRKGQKSAKLAADISKSIEPLIVYARNLCDKDLGSESELISAIALIGCYSSKTPADLERIAKLVSPNRAAGVQTAAITALARTADKHVPDWLISVWGSATPLVRAQILDTLLARPAWQTELLVAIEKGRIPAGQIDAARRQRLATSKDEGIRKLTEKLFAGSTSADRAKIIDDYKTALTMTGLASRGKSVFAKSCSACHVLHGVGHAVGPDLAALTNKSPLYLLTEILDPSRNLDTRYAEYQAITLDERTISGILAAESATSVTLRGQQGSEATILRSNLQELRGTSKSLMPEGLEKELTKQDIADLLAYLMANDVSHKKLPGNSPTEITLRDNSLTLPAVLAYVYGDQITFETEFKNIGYWHSENDYVMWKIRTDKPGTFDVYLDYACSPDFTSNQYALDGGEPELRGPIKSTGGWDRYSLVKLGSVQVPAGAGRITFRPATRVRGAFLDLRTLYFVQQGTQPIPGKPRIEQPRSATELAKFIIDENLPKDRRETLVKESLPMAGEVVRAMVADLKPNNTEEEYRRIPWIWRVSVAAGRANDVKVLASLLEASLPKPGESLRDWQAVVIGGGIINGLGLEGVWPKSRLAELLKNKPELSLRWADTLKQSHVMADSDKIPNGTRYDALRIVALDTWSAAQPRLLPYLKQEVNAELQQGAVSGFVDIEEPAATGVLIGALPKLTAGKRNFALTGLLRSPARVTSLLDALEKGLVMANWLTNEHRESLLKYPDEAIRARSARYLKR
jgi:putative membrane-bound dehydrogenase-like protein